MSKVLASKGGNGSPVSARYTRDDEPPRPGEVEIALPVDVDLGPWLDTVVWDESTGAPRAPTQAEELTNAKAEQENLVRDAANAEYLAKVRAFEGAVIAAKWAKGVPLNADESQIFNGMSNGYSRMSNLVSQIRLATTIEAVKAITW